MRLLSIAIGFTVVYLAEFVLFGIGALKEGGGRGLFYSFGVTALVLWLGFFFLRRSKLKYRTAAFAAFAFALCFWVAPAWRIELAVEEYDDRRTNDLLRRIEVSDVSDEPLLNSQGRAIGIRMRYSVRFPQDDTYSPGPLLTTTDERLQQNGMRVIASQIAPRPQEVRAGSLGTDTFARYKGNVSYAFVVDMVPNFLILSGDQSKSCLSFFSPTDKAIVSTSDIPIPFRVHIGGTGYGGYFGGPPQFTRNAYSLSEFYRNAVEQGAKDTCAFDGRGEIQ